jgi:hypothetical protein
MFIETTVKMTLEDSEINALKTLKETYIQCVTTEQFSCNDCPLLDGDMCIAKHADNIVRIRGLK